MVIVFAGFTLDTDTDELWRGGEPVRVRPRTMAVLRYLAERPGALVTKMELLDAVWSDVAVTEQVLTVCISELRALLADATASRSIIDTVHRRGYRFIAAVETRSGDPARDTQSCEELLQRARSEWSRGAFAEAQETVREAAVLARRAGLPEHLGRAALSFGGPVPRPASFNEQGAMVEEALSALPRGDTALRARLLAQLATVSHLSQPRQARERLCEEALAIAERLRDGALIDSVLESAHRALWEPHHLEWRLRTAERLIESARASGHGGRELQGLVLRMTDHFECADLGGVERDIASYRARAEDLGERLHLAAGDWFEAMLHSSRALLEGRLSEVARLTERVLALGERLQPDLARQYLGIQLFVLHREEGNLAGLAAGLASATAGPPPSPGVRRGLASICLPTFQQSFAEFWNDPGWDVGAALVNAELGEEEAARRHLETLARDDFADLLRSPAWMAGASLLAVACRELADDRRAAVLLEALRPWETRAIVVGPASCLGSAAHPLALLAVTLRHWGEAETWFESAIAAHERLGARGLEARARYDYARALLERGRPRDRERAADQAAAAAVAAGRIGMRIVAEKAEQIRSRLARDRGRVAKLRNS